MKSLAGTYTLKTHGIHKPDGTYAPTSDYLLGEIHYGEDGSLSVLMVFSKEPKVAKDVYGYVGTYRVTSPNIVEHQMSISTSARQVNTTEERTYEFVEGGIKLGRLYPDGDRFEALWLRK